MGGLLFTCGLSQVGPMEYDSNGIERPKHGLIRSTPASNPSSCCEWFGDEYHMIIRGEMRETSLFDNNLILRRTIKTILGIPEIVIEDEIQNEGFQEAPLMLMYHCNFGFPFLSEKTIIMMDQRSIRPRDENSMVEVDLWAKFGEPTDSCQEQVFYHELNESCPGEAQASIHNPDVGISVHIRYSLTELPYMIQWKSQLSGDYALGLEPANCHSEGQDRERENQTLRFIKPGESVRTFLKISFVKDHL